MEDSEELKARRLQLCKELEGSITNPTGVELFGVIAIYAVFLAVGFALLFAIL